MAKEVLTVSVQREPASEFKAFEKALHKAERLADQLNKPHWLYPARTGYEVSDTEPDPHQVRIGFKAVKIHPSNEAHKF